MKILISATAVLAVFTLTLLLAGMVNVPPPDVASASLSSEVTYTIGSNTFYTIPSGYNDTSIAYVDIYKPEKTWNGTTFFSIGNGIIEVNMKGEIVWQYQPNWTNMIFAS